MEKITGIAIDTTGSTPVLTDRKGNPLAMTDRFKDDPDAMFILWKDHSAQEEAVLITQKARESCYDYTKYSGGVYSSEWFWAKLLHTLKTNKTLAEAAYTAVEHVDWISALITGTEHLK